VDHYEVVTSDVVPASAADFAGATQLKPPTPAAPGATQSLNLAFNLRRYVAVRAVDDQGNVGRVAVVDRQVAGGGTGGTGNGGGGGTNNGGGGNSSGGCADKLAPRSAISRRALRARRRGIKVSGTSRDRGCAGLKRVDVVIAKLSGRKCRFAGSGGRLSHRRKCSRLGLIHAHGTRKWRLNLNHQMPPGRYRIVASGLDKKGNREPRRSANTITVRIK
jgi:hypothetical protein